MEKTLSAIIWHTLQPVEFPQVAEDETPQVAMHDVHRLSPPLELQNHFMMIFMMIFKSH